MNAAPPALPFLISWNLTRRCNLKCAHCYLDSAGMAGADNLSTDEALRFVDEIASLNPRAMLILTGGEPLVRTDLFEIASRASSRGLMVVLGTNGTLMNGAVAKRLIESGIKGAGISLDSASPLFHDRFRGVDNAWDNAVRAADILRAHGVDFQLQFTVTRGNKEELPRIIELAAQKGARAVNVFFMVCTGRGQEMTDLGPEDYEAALSYLAEAEDEWRGRLIVRARCAPHFLRIAGQTDPEGPLHKGAASGCIAASSYLRISPEGFVTPCPYIPHNAKSPNLKDISLREIWETDETFLSLRSPSLKGRCARCDWEKLCGGCRARAFAHSGDLMAEDPWCSYDPVKTKTVKGKNSNDAPVWTSDAEKRLEGAPFFLRSMIKAGLERYAKAKGLREITPEMMKELREKVSLPKEGHGRG
ncbi:MAG: radical SAM protein [Deltaproteobacteria bacterium]|nr:radical SAM protein [Deltaproteobacteria bacterium]